MPVSNRVLGQAAPANTNNADLYTVPANTTAVASTLHIANVTNNNATFQVYVRIAGAAAANANAIAFNVTLGGNSFIAMTTGITLGAGDIVTVRSSVANALTFTLFGVQVTP